MATLPQRLWRATMAASKAFREEFTQSSPLRIDDYFNTADGRRLRYQINWAMYENTAYQRAHLWAESYKTAFGLYRYIRNIYNPSYRLGEFWQAHLWGGALDPAAGDGSQVPTALPISTENDALRPAIAKIWEWSNWQAGKGIVTLRGAVLGDSVIKIVDDPERRKVYMEPVHPGSIYDITLDKWGNVKGYILEEERIDPKGNNKVTYRETAERDGENVIYRTYINGSLYAWDGVSAEWSVAYGFVPLVMIQHKNVGLNWGWAEMHAGLANFREIDDQASLLDDQIRKIVNSGWLFSGVSAPSGSIKPGAPTSTNTNPQPGREDMPALYGPVGATATPLIAPLDIAQVSANIQSIIKKIERDYPELSETLENASGDISGRALRINRQPVINKVQERRPNYDAALVRAQQMAVAIGGFRGYDTAFSGFGLDSYANGTLDHTIKERPVFSKDPLDDLEVEAALWNAAAAAKTAGIPLTMFLRRQGWAENQIQDIENSPENQARLAMLDSSMIASRALLSSEAGPQRSNPGQFQSQNQQNQPGK